MKTVIQTKLHGEKKQHVSNGNSSVLHSIRIYHRVNQDFPAPLQAFSKLVMRLIGW